MPPPSCRPHSMPGVLESGSCRPGQPVAQWRKASCTSNHNRRTPFLPRAIETLVQVAVLRPNSASERANWSGDQPTTARSRSLTKAAAPSCMRQNALSPIMPRMRSIANSGNGIAAAEPQPHGCASRSRCPSSDRRPDATRAPTKCSVRGARRVARRRFRAGGRGSWTTSVYLAVRIGGRLSSREPKYAPRPPSPLRGRDRAAEPAGSASPLR